jgi:hypothetical protein
MNSVSIQKARPEAFNGGSLKPQRLPRLQFRCPISIPTQYQPPNPLREVGHRAGGVSVLDLPRRQ